MIQNKGPHKIIKKIVKAFWLLIYCSIDVLNWTSGVLDCWLHLTRHSKTPFSALTPLIVQLKKQNKTGRLMEPFVGILWRAGLGVSCHLNKRGICWYWCAFFGGDLTFSWDCWTCAFLLQWSWRCYAWDSGMLEVLVCGLWLFDPTVCILLITVFYSII